MRQLTLVTAIALVVLAAPSMRAQDAPSRFGLVAGRIYSYTGTARWADSMQRVHSSPVRWRMDVVEVRSSRDARAALVRGWVQDLAWYTAGQRAQFSVLLELRNGLYQLPIRDSTAAMDTLIEAVRDPSVVAKRFRLVIDSSLMVGRAFGQDLDRGNRNDELYAWLVESKTTISDHPQWLSFAVEPVRWRLAYRTLPDHQLIDFVSGVGITRFVYAHHGTVANTDIHLSTVTSSRRRGSTTRPR